MSDIPWSVLGLGVFVGATVVTAIWRAAFSIPTSVPGPFIAKFTDMWYAWKVYRGHFEQENVRLHKKYGPVIRYGVNRYSISDPFAAKLIYGTGSKCNKSSWYDSWSGPHPDAWNLFGDRDAKRHAVNRRQYQNTYSMSSLVNYEAYVDDCADIFCQRLEEMSARDKWVRPIDMGHWLQCYAFDVICLITYSKRMGFLDLGDDVGEVMQNLKDHLAYATLVGIYPQFHPIIFPIRNWLAGSRGRGRQYIINYTQECMADHQSKPIAGATERLQLDESRGTVDFLSKFMQKHSENPDVFTMYHTLAGCVSNMVAGSDTTSISLSAILYYVLQNATVLKKLQAEVDQICPQNMSSPHITFAYSQEMPYLQAVIKEALRMHPATGLPLERVVPEGGATISGVFFPAGVTVGINSWVEHSNKAIFGEDADIFNPDRWLSEDKDRTSTMNRHWMPFGLGSRTCIGRHISMLEISKLIPRLIRDFDMELSKGVPWETQNYWFVKPKNFKVLVRPRIAKT